MLRRMPLRSFLPCRERAAAVAKELLDEVGTTYAAKRLLNLAVLLGLIPEEELALSLLLGGSLGAEHRL